jgi:hypothetical protein
MLGWNPGETKWKNPADEDMQDLRGMLSADRLGMRE